MSGSDKHCERVKPSGTSLDVNYQNGEGSGATKPIPCAQSTKGRRTMDQKKVRTPKAARTKYLI
jgi:hypothetical protein